VKEQTVTKHLKPMVDKTEKRCMFSLKEQLLFRLKQTVSEDPDGTSVFLFLFPSDVDIDHDYYYVDDDDDDDDDDVMM